MMEKSLDQVVEELENYRDFFEKTCNELKKDDSAGEATENIMCLAEKLSEELKAIEDHYAGIREGTE
ncbi:hypothetical protein MOC76_16360 [Bacillus spizizenii]|uniref:hypothetical protein n=1 Tax=Bacillus spizizenii TaxID=96241 RepID=UPI00227E79BC|nr:hypothetical protein [Bacillus spizizenii]MCY8135334.1 hypothetical protein [Bacillus spizizenii]MCY8256910.1 hypothetical protein [Bacillus spizizenii]MCY8331413.1 hypothetical protein [Bacillus spizizenii]MCY9443503.1 hypothetical protein [Bacillus spizizenii]MEC1461516.1 hypothetical protein [Bacillus spizizenii]